MATWQGHCPWPGKTKYNLSPIFLLVVLDVVFCMRPHTQGCSCKLSVYAKLAEGCALWLREIIDSRAADHLRPAVNDS